MKLSKEAWVRLPLALLQEVELKHSAVEVCVMLVDRATSAAELYDWFEVSIPDLMSDTRYSRMTVYSALRDLERLGLIEVQHAGQSGAVNKYRLASRCVEVRRRASEPKQRGTRKAQQRAAREKAEASRKRDLESYAELSNRFEEPLEGQMEFPEEPKPQPTAPPRPDQLPLDDWLQWFKENHT